MSFVKRSGPRVMTNRRRGEISITHIYIYCICIWRLLLCLTVGNESLITVNFRAIPAVFAHFFKPCPNQAKSAKIAARVGYVVWIIVFTLNGGNAHVHASFHRERGTKQSYFSSPFNLNNYTSLKHVRTLTYYRDLLFMHFYLFIWVIISRLIKFLLLFLLIYDEIFFLNYSFL